MILKLARRDPAWMFGLVFVGTYLLALLIGNGPLAPGMLPGWAMAMFAASMTNLRPQWRATLWEAALPIPARQLFLARALSRGAMVWVPLIVGGSLTVILKGAGWSSLDATLKCGTILTVAILLPQAVRVRELAIPAWLVAAIWAAVLGAGLLAWRQLPAAVTLALFALASAWIFARIWMTVPLSFQTAPLEAAGRRKISPARSGPALPWWPFARSYAWSSFGFLPLVIMLPGSWLFVCIFGALALDASRSTTRWLDSLPLSHRTRLLINLLPALVMVVGAAIGLHFAPDINTVGIGDKTTLTDGQPGIPDIAVPVEFWKHARGDAAPLIESPWGETSRPAIFSVFGYRLYNPYSIGPGNSQRFFDWQFERATEAVYGRPLNPRQLDKAKQAGLTPITARPRMRVLNLAALALFLLVLIFSRELFRWRRVCPLSRLAQGLFMTARVALPLGAILVLFFIPTLHGGAVAMSQQLIQGLLLRIAALLPDNLLAATLAALVPVALMYLLLERLFAQTEFLGPVRVPSLWGADASG